MENQLQKIKFTVHKSKKLVNFRLPVLLFLLLVATTLLLTYFGIYALFFNIVLLLFAIGYTVFLSIKGKKLLNFIFCIFCILFVVNLCIVQFFIQIGRYNTVVDLSMPVAVQGRVVEIVEHSAFSKTLLLQSEKLRTADGKTLKNGNIKVQLSGTSTIKIGESIAFTSPLEQYILDTESLTSGGVSGGLTNFIENIRYTATIKATSIEKVEPLESNIFIYLRRKVYTLLFENFDSEIASFAYAMLIGDNNFIEPDSLQNIRYAGIAHIFAISGLHIGILYTILLTIFKKLPRMKWLQFFTIGAVLFLYCGVCRFSISTMRASIMAMLSLFAKLTFTRRDSLNILATAGCILLLLKPLQLFTIGFQLSMVTVFALTVLAPHFFRLFCVKNKAVNKIIQIILVPCLVQLATFPFLLNAFGYTSLLSVFVNILCIPLLSGIFVLLFVALLLALLFTPLATILLFLPMCLLRLLLEPLTIFSFQIFIVSGFAFGGGAIVAWLLALFILTDKVNLSVWAKAVAVSLLSLTVLLLYGIQTVLPKQYTRLLLSQYYDSRVLLLQEENKNYLLTDTSLSTNFLQDLFLRQNVKYIDGLYLFSDDVKYINSTLPTVHRLAPIKIAYTLRKDLQSAFLGIDMLSLQENFTVGSFQGRVVGSGALSLLQDKSSILVVNIAENIVYPKADILITTTYSAQIESVVMSKAVYYWGSVVTIPESAIECRRVVLKEVDKCTIVLPKDRTAKGKEYAIYTTEREFKRKNLSNLSIARGR